MNLLQLVLPLCLASLVQCSHATTITLNRRPGSGNTRIYTDNSASPFGNFGPFGQIITKVQRSLQQATVIICDRSHMCSSDILNEAPFRQILGPNQLQQERPKSLGSIINELNPIEVLKTAFKDFRAGVNKAEEDIIFAPFKPFIDIAENVFGIFG